MRTATQLALRVGLRDRRSLAVFLAALLTMPVAVLTWSVAIPVVRAVVPAPVAGEAAPAPRPEGPAGVPRGLLIHQAALETRLAMASGDSVNLFVDLVDSVVTLEIRGVVVRRAPILDARESAGLRHLPGAALQEWLGRPFTLTAALGTTARIPITVRKAPRDTVEAARMATEPIVAPRNDMYVLLAFDRNLSIVIRQAETPSWAGWLAARIFDLRVLARDMGEATAALAELRSPDAAYRVHLTLSRDDARAIYRALPDRALAGIRPGE